MDKNDELYQMFVRYLSKSVNIIINTRIGLSEARNIGIENATGNIIVFIDDDASADKSYISRLIKNYGDEKTVCVFGKILPKGKPNFPEELYWIGGFTNKGFAEKKCEVRNGYGCNMSFRKEIFDKVGLFNSRFGRIGKSLVTCEETEFCIKMWNSLSDIKIIYDPSVIVYHKVHRYRQTLRYMIIRAYYEGIYKAHIDRLFKNMRGNVKALSTENTYLRYLFTKAIPSRILDIFNGKNIIYNTKGVIFILIVVYSVGFGHMIGKFQKLK